MKEKIRQFLAAVADYVSATGTTVRLQENEMLAPHTTFHIGGTADLYAEPSSGDALQFLLRLAAQTEMRSIVIGRGSNLLFDDRGYRGIVISTAAMKEISVDGETLTADSGASLARCANAALASALSGMEFAYGIPGSIGGAVFMNAGAYGGEMKDIVKHTWAYDRLANTTVEIPAENHAFDYRTSLFRHRPELVILRTTLQLKTGNRDEIQSKMEDLMRRRMEKQPLEFPSAGSTFKRYPGRFTGQMIEEAGLKGYRIGGAEVSEKHAGFIINRASATSSDVLALIAHVQNTVEKQFGVQIEPEVVYVPES